MKKMAFFDQKHGLTLLKKCDFGGLEKIFYSQEKFLFYLEYY